MSRISDAFMPGHKVLIPYVTVGYPTIESTLEVVPLLAKSGCDIIELGIPYSDPLADGATIQKASFTALQNGVTPQLCLEVVAALRQKVDTPLVFMTYYNPVLNLGLEAFCHASADAGVAGLIIPDLPPEEGRDLEKASRRYILDLIYLLAPTSTEERIRLVAGKSRGFIYLVSLAGVTGARNSLPPDLGKFVSRVRKIARQPLCIGFGISTPQQARQAAQLVDGVIIGSRIIQLMEADKSLSAVQDFILKVRAALPIG